MQAHAGSLRVALLSGEAGIGKTTLLAALARICDRPGQRHRRLRALRRRPGGAAAAVPRRWWARSSTTRRRTVLRAHCERYGGELARIAPHLLNRIWAPPPTGPDDATGNYQLFEAVADLVRRLAAWGPLRPRPRRPALGRADRAAPAPAPRPRADRRAGAGRGVLPRHGRAVDRARGGAGRPRTAEVRRIALAGFDDAELSELVVSVTEAPSASGRRCPGTAPRPRPAGNPLYAVQLVRHLARVGSARRRRRHRALRRVQHHGPPS